ncbi:MAG: hypothetical protein KBA31_18135 [Alphaproteobacteria bacterium]|nr:hypothetical protein [Alphaproteobacteria bacterium]
MTLEEIYYVSQIVAVVAIFCSLIFVGLQMRAQTRETRYSTMNQILTDYDQILSAWSNDALAAQDYFAGVNGGLEAISVERRAAHVFLVSRLLRLYERAYIQRTAGRLGDDAWEAIHRGVEPATAGKSFKEYWQSRKSFFSPAFVAFVDKEMQRNQPIAFPQNFYAASPALAQPALSETQSPQP